MMYRPEEQRPKKKEKKSYKKSIRIVSVVVIIAILAGTIVSFCYKKSDSVATPIQEQIVEQPIQPTTEYSILENYAIPSNIPSCPMKLTTTVRQKSSSTTRIVT